MKWVYDREADAASLRIAEGQIDGSEEVAPGIILDFSEDDRLLGIEVLSASRRLPASVLKAAGAALAAE